MAPARFHGPVVPPEEDEPTTPTSPEPIIAPDPEPSVKTPQSEKIPFEFKMTVKSYCGDDRDQNRNGRQLAASASSATPQQGGDHNNNNNNKNNNNPRKKKTLRSRVFRTFDDDYQSTSTELGRGSFGRVLVCLDRRTGREAAVKVLPKRTSERRRVMNQVDTFHLCRHQDNIVRLLDYYEDDSAHYLVFEKVDGGPLLKHLQRRNRFEEEEASRIVGQLARALHFLHGRGIAHRDLKPDNVLCVRLDTAYPVKLCDLDFCSTVPAASGGVGGVGGVVCGTRGKSPRLRTPVGSLEYMAPEVIDAFLSGDSSFFSLGADLVDADDSSSSDTSYYDKKCDVWSLGVVLFILLSGRPPFSGQCGRDGCGWDSGEACQACSDDLAMAIKEGRVHGLDGDDDVYEDDDDDDVWVGVSEEAKSLLRAMLVKDAKRRADTSSILLHPWIVEEGSSNPLPTPRTLRRQSSLQDLSNFTSDVLRISRALTPLPCPKNDDENNNGRLVKSKETLSGSLVKSSSLDLATPTGYAPKMATPTRSQLLQRRNKLLRWRSMNHCFSSIDENMPLL